MFKELAPLNTKTDANLKYSPAKDFSFAKEEVQTPILINEFAAASRYYPIVFPASGTMLPQALLGVAQKQNLFISEDGKWQVPYIPQHFRRYPFVTGKMSEENQFAIMIDRASGQFSESEGDALYEEKDGTFQPSGLLNRIKDELMKLHQALEATKTLVAPLEEHGVLENYKATLGKGDNEKQIRGLRIVDWKKVKELDDNVLADWVRSGLMQMIHLHLLSLDNMRVLQGLRGSRQ